MSRPDREQASSQELAALCTLAREVASSLSIEAVVAAALRGILAAVTPDIAYFFTRDGSRLILRGVVPEDARARVGFIPEHCAGQCLCGLAAEKKEPIYSTDIHADPRCTWKECRQAGVRSLAALPLRAGSQVIGVLGIASFATRDFATRSRFLETLADVIAVSLQNAHLFRDVEEAARTVDRERRFAESLIAGLPGVFYLIDEHGRFLRWNRNFEVVIGRSAEEMARAHPLDFFEGRDRGLIAERIARVFAEGSADAEADFVAKDGTRRPYYFTGLRILVDGKPCLIGLGIDVSERRELQERLLHTEKLAALGRLAGGVAHDFNNQLAGILGYADLLSRSVEDEHLRRHADAILHLGQRSADLVRQLLAFGRKAKRLSVPVDVHRLIKEVAGLLERSMDRRIRVRLDLRAPAATVTGDPALLQNALLNLAVNARDAMPEGGELHFATDVTSGDETGLGPEPCLRIRVTDTGSGMTEDVRRHAFEPFYTTKEPGQGTGMGLASVYGTVQSHAGGIRIESEVGRGTTVTTWLPLSDAPESVDAQPEPEAPRIGGASVLVIDDEPDVCEMAASALRASGYRAVAFRSAPEAVAHYRDHWRTVDLVLVDLLMPEMGGRDVFRRLREANPDVRAVLTSGHGPPAEIEVLLREGFRGFLPKPYLVADLARIVGEALRGSGDAGGTIEQDLGRPS